MIGKQEWFGSRKYTGWGLTPRTWQGWAYIAAIIAPIIIVNQIGAIGGELKMWLSIIWAGIFAVDLISIMIKVERRQDEREKVHQAFAERNALWMIMLVMIVGVAYQAAQSVIDQGFKVDPVIIIALVAGVIAKAATNIYLDKKD